MTHSHISLTIDSYTDAYMWSQMSPLVMTWIKR